MHTHMKERVAEMTKVAKEVLVRRLCGTKEHSCVGYHARAWPKSWSSLLLLDSPAQPVRQAQRAADAQRTRRGPSARL